MKNLYKISNLILLCMLFSFFAKAQSSEVQQLADERVDAINKMITSVDATLALSPEQRKKISELHIERTKKIRAAKKNNLSGEDKETVKAEAIKLFNQTVNSEVLTKEQAQAKREAKKE